MALRPVFDHPWDLTTHDAVKLQEQLQEEIVQNDDLPARVGVVAGVDAAYSEDSPMVHAAFVLLDATSGAVLEVSGASVESTFPYVPGLFAFREIPALLAAASRLERTPDLIFCDSQGRAHPRRFGLACHLGLLLGIPTIGCAKTRLAGTAVEPDPERGSFQPLLDKGEVVGVMLRTQSGVKPIYVSVGHMISLDTARDWVLRVTPEYRLPQPIRLAHQECNRLRKGSPV